MTNYPHLRDHLAAGGTLDEHEASALYEEMVSAVCSTPEQRARRAALARHESQCPTPIPKADGTESRMWWRCKIDSWEADYLEAFPDPELEALVLAALPRDLAEDVEPARDCLRRPYPIFIGPADSPFGAWSCDNCGTEYNERTEALVIGHESTWGDVGSPIYYCAACIGLAAAGMGAASEPAAT